MSLVRTALLVFASVAALAFACTAELEENCITGPCGPAAQPTFQAPPPVACLDDPDTGDLPCDVSKVLRDRCQCCHQLEPRGGAPFPLMRWEDVHAQYYTTDRKIWERMAEVIQPDSLLPMPFEVRDLDAKEFATLDAWLTAGAPPAEQGAGCECAEVPPGACEPL